jgi:hypothetical protein
VLSLRGHVQSDPAALSLSTAVVVLHLLHAACCPLGDFTWMCGCCGAHGREQGWMCSTDPPCPSPKVPSSAVCGTPGATHLAGARAVLAAMSRLHGHLVQRFVRHCFATSTQNAALQGLNPVTMGPCCCTGAAMLRKLCLILSQCDQKLLCHSAVSRAGSAEVALWKRLLECM